MIYKVCIMGADSGSELDKLLGQDVGSLRGSILSISAKAIYVW